MTRAWREDTATSPEIHVQLTGDPVVVVFTPSRAYEVAAEMRADADVIETAAGGAA